MFDKFVRWLKFNPPSAATADEWTDWEMSYKNEASIRYFITHTLPTPFKHFKWKIERGYQWVRYRFARYHILDTGLEPGYYDADTLMLHVNFNLLKDFVEIEKASMQHVCSNDDYSLDWKHKIPFYSRLFFRSRELGIRYLEWESALDNPDSKHYNKDSYGYYTPKEGEYTQASAAREVLALYCWWVAIRPARVEIPSPREAYKDMPILYRLSDKYKEEHPTEYIDWKQWCKDSEQQEEEWKKEDDDMLIRLMKIRHHMWT